MANEKPKNSVAVRAIRWASSGWSKQKLENQDDTMGGYQKRVSLVKPDGKEVVIQDKGKPTDAIPTFQRQLLKLTIAAWFCRATKKGDMFLDSIGLNLRNEEDTAFLKKLADDGWKIDAQYGAGSRLHTPVSTFLNALGSLAEARVDTLAQYPPEVGSTDPAAEEEVVVEEVTLVL